MGEFVRLEVEDGVGTIRVDRPKMNALDVQVQEEIRAAAAESTERDDVRAVVLYGGERVFAAGADIKEMADMSYSDMVKRSGALQSSLSAVARIPKPVVAAVTGYALGGGCELALVCDMIVASETAEFGQPEILLGIIPGAGGTQRLARTVGKQRAMELVLTGRRIGAEEAHRMGIVNQVTGKKDWLAKAVELAQVVARRPPVAVRLGKQAVLAAEETTLSAGVDYERRLYEIAMATEDRIEGMTAFIEKRKPDFKGR